MKKISILLLCILFLAACSGKVKEAEVTSEVIVKDEIVMHYEIYAEKGASSYSLFKMMEEDKQNSYHVNLSTEEMEDAIVQGKAQIAFLNYETAARYEDKVEIVGITAMDNLYMIHNGPEFEAIKQFAFGKIFVLDRKLDKILLQRMVDEYDIEEELDVEYLKSYEEVCEKLKSTANSVAIVQQPYVSFTRNTGENISIVKNLSDFSDTYLLTDCMVVQKNIYESENKNITYYMEMFYKYNTFGYKNPEKYMELVKKYDPDNYFEEMEKDVSSMGFVFLKDDIMKKAREIFEEEIK